MSASDGSKTAFVDGLSPYDWRILDKARVYEIRLPALKVDAHRIFTIESRGFPTAALIQS